MASILTYDPGSTEAQSPLIAGLTEGLNKISSVLEMGVSELTNVQLYNVPISDTDKNRIYQANMGNRLWLDDPAPVFKKNGVEIKKETDGFEVDYVGGSISFPVNNRLEDSDVVTVTCKYVNNTSKTVSDIQTTVSAVTELSVRYKGAYNTVEELENAQHNSKNGDFAVVLSAPAVYVSKNGVWTDTRSIEDLSNYYTKEEVNNIAATKEPTIPAKGNSLDDDNYYYGGRKTWQNINNKVISATLTGLDTSSSSDITAEDTVLSGFGKMQGKALDYDTKVIIRDNKTPNEETVGSIGQRYIHTSTGKVYICRGEENGKYIWEEDGIPSGGVSDDILIKQTNEDYAVKWDNASKVSLVPPKSFTSKPIVSTSYDGNTTVNGTPSPDNPATLTPVEPPEVPGAAKQIGPLWSLPDGTKDTYDGVTGELVRRVGKLVLDGSENWIFAENKYCLLEFDAKSYSRTISSHITVDDNYADGITIPSYYINSFGDIVVAYEDEGNGVDNFKAFLASQYAAGTPVIVLYELAQPTVEHIIYTGPISTRATDILAPSWTGKTTIIGDPSPDNPATITGVPFAATATGPDNQTRSVDLGFTGYSLPDGTVDTFDGVRGDFVQRVGKLDFNDFVNDPNSIPRNVDDLGDVFRFAFDNASIYKASKSAIGHCTHFTTNGNYQGNYQHWYAYERFFALYIPKSIISEGTIDNLKSWLAAQAAAGTPVTAYYELAEPIANNRKADITAFDGQTAVTGADAVEVIEGRVLRVADCLPFEIVRSNPNLQDNWYFGAPINQRGLKEYTTGYCIDRFSISGQDGKKINVSDNYIEITSPSMFGCFFAQLIDIKIIKHFIGHKIIFSVLFEGNYNGGSFSPSIYINGKYSSTTTSYGLLKAAEATIPKDIESMYVQIGADSAGVSRIFAEKLEFGNQQTLARKVGDRWVLNDPPPDPALELLKCQRYFQIFATESLRPTDKDDFRPTMRATPNLGTIVIDGKTYYTASAEL